MHDRIKLVPWVDRVASWGHMSMSSSQYHLSLQGLGLLASDTELASPDWDSCVFQSPAESPARSKVLAPGVPGLGQVSVLPLSSRGSQ